MVISLAFLNLHGNFFSFLGTDAIFNHIHYKPLCMLAGLLAGSAADLAAAECFQLAVVSIFPSVVGIADTYLVVTFL
jgi:hypothetical protein